MMIYNIIKRAFKKFKYDEKRFFNSHLNRTIKKSNLTCMKSILCICVVVAFELLSIKTVNAQLNPKDSATIWQRVRKTMTNFKPVDFVDGVYQKRTTLERSPAPLPLTREADVIWQKVVWRQINFLEKANQHFYFPSTGINNRLNLITILLSAIDKNYLMAFDYDVLGIKYEFSKPLSYRSIDSTLNLINPIREDAIKEVKALIIKELWYFDKQKSTLQVRIIGICPMINKDKHLNGLFWIYYPQARPLLSKYEVLNGYNGARNLSYDDIFLTRNFDGYIIKEENTYNNRSIEMYASGEYAARESERIKNAIFNYEQDLWEY